MVRFTLLLLLFVVAGCGERRVKRPVLVLPPPAVVEAPRSEEERSRVVRFEDVLLALHNEERARRGLGGLVEDAELDRCAERHAEWMARTGALRHQNLSLLRGAWSLLGENIACGQLSEQEVFDCWMRSSGHRRNILTGGFTRVGFGMARAASGRLFWCVVLAR